MFKSIRQYFAGVPANEIEPILTMPKRSCSLCTDLGYTCGEHFVPGEPVLSILRAVKTRRKTILLASKVHYSQTPYGAAQYKYGFADTQTGRCVTVQTSHKRHSSAVKCSVDVGLNPPELLWLIREIRSRLDTVRARAAALAGARIRRQLMQEYVK